MTATEQPTSTDWYRPGPRMQEFHASRARVRALIGARGTGKTTGIAVETIGHGWHNPGAKTYILRKTQSANEDSTQDTFDQVFRKSGSAYVDTGVSLFRKMEGGKRYRLPSEEAVHRYGRFLKGRPTKGQKQRWLETEGNRYCSHLLFSGVPDQGRQAERFRGFECSQLIFVEADQLTREDFNLAQACLRWKGADGEFIRDAHCILDTNPPTPRHWIAHLEEEVKEDPSFQFWHIPTFENAHNLPPGYVENLIATYRGNNAMLRRMVYGEYAEAFDGAPVFWAFSETHAHEDLPWPRGAYMVRSWDFGTTHGVVWSAYWEVEGEEYWWDLYEYFATQSDTERQCRAVIERTAEVFPYWNDRGICAGVYDACDPAGAARTATGRNLDVLNSFGIRPRYNNKHKSLPITLAAYNRLLEKKDKAGRLVYRIDKKSCPRLYLASLGGYRYPEEGEPGFGGDEPGKGPFFGDFDHIADASRYGKVNFMRLVRVACEQAARPRAIASRRVNLNPKRRWR